MFPVVVAAGAAQQRVGRNKTMLKIRATLIVIFLGLLVQVEKPGKTANGKNRDGLSQPHSHGQLVKEQLFALHTARD